MRLCLHMIQSVCVCMFVCMAPHDFDRCLFADLEMPRLLKSVLFNKTGIMLRLAIRRKCADCWHVGDVSES